MKVTFDHNSKDLRKAVLIDGKSVEDITQKFLDNTSIFMEADCTSQRIENLVNSEFTREEIACMLVLTMEKSIQDKDKNSSSSILRELLEVKLSGGTAVTVDQEPNKEELEAKIRAIVGPECDFDIEHSSLGYRLRISKDSITPEKKDALMECLNSL